MSSRFGNYGISTVTLLAGILGMVSPGSPVLAGDWPQILGPTRNGIAVDEKLVDRLPADGPQTLWQRPVGEGFAGVAVGEGMTVLFHRVKDEEVVEGMVPTTGEVIWTSPSPTAYVSTISEDSGPRCVPVIHKGRVYTYGARGLLRCLDLKTGKEVWQRDTHAEFDTPDGYFGAGSSPLVEGDKLLLNVGGRNGTGIVAFSLATGKTLWKATTEQASYSSPVAATVDDVRHVVFVTRLQTVSLDPETGTVRFRVPFGQRGPTVNAANPLVFDGHLFLSASYGIGATLLKIDKNDAEVVWAKDDVMSSQYSTCVRHDDYLYGVDGRQDLGVARLRCIEPMTGRVLWTEDGFGMATLILADGKLVIMKSDGTLVLARPSPKGFRSLGSTRLFRGTVRALPALSEGLLSVRDGRTLKCVDLRPAR